MTKYKQVPVAEVVSGYSGDPDTRGDKKLRVLDLSQCEIGDKLYSTTPTVQGEPVGWQFYEDGKWWNGDDRIKDHRKNTEAAGIPVRDVYAAPQTVEQPECGCCGQTVKCDDDCDAVVLRKVVQQQGR